MRTSSSGMVSGLGSFMVPLAAIAVVLFATIH